MIYIKDGLAIHKFYSQTCGACKIIAPYLDEIKKESDGEVALIGYDVTGDKETTTELGITALPTIIITRDGEEVDRIVGFKPKEFYEEALFKAAKGI